MFGLPNFVFYLIAGVIGAFAVSGGRWVGHKYIPHFPDMPLMLGQILARGKSEKTIRVTGRYMHLVTGALWGSVFGWLVGQQFFFVEFTIVSGLLFGILPWLFLMIVIHPPRSVAFLHLFFYPCTLTPSRICRRESLKSLH